MNMLILNAARQSELGDLNASGDETRQLNPVPLTSGDAALTAGLLTDCGAGQTWEHYGSFLETLPIAEVSVEQIVEPQIS